MPLNQSGPFWGDMVAGQDIQQERTKTPYNSSPLQKFAYKPQMILNPEKLLNRCSSITISLRMKTFDSIDPHQKVGKLTRLVNPTNYQITDNLDNGL